jgi:microcystin-dependent protein
MWDETSRSDPPKRPFRLFTTPSTEPPTCFTFRRLSIPDDPAWLALVNGAVSALTNPCFWEDRGGQPIDLVIETFLEMWLDYIGEAENMIGAVFAMITDVLPNNMLWADGSTYDRSIYPDLYGRLPAEFIVDADSFTVPDLRGRVVVGSGPGAGLTDRAVGDTGGEEAHQLTEGELAAHTHGVYMEHLINVTPNADPGTPLSEHISANKETTSTGGDEAHNNMPPYFALRFAIVAKSRDAC